MKNKHVQKITVNSDTGIFISNIQIDSNEIEYCVMRGNEMVSEKKRAFIEFTSDGMVSFDGIQINKQYLIQLMSERDYTIDEMEGMFNNNS